MAKPEFKQPENVRFKPAEPPPVNLFDDEPASSAALVDEWRAFDPALASNVHFTAPPYDGLPVVLRALAGPDMIAAWKLSRRFSLPDKRFVPCGFWARYRMGAVRVTFEPLGWKPYLEPTSAAGRRSA